MKIKKESKRIDELKPIKIVTAAAIIATTLFTPTLDVLPGKYNMIYADQKNLNILVANASNKWQGAEFEPNNAVKEQSNYLRWGVASGNYSFLHPGKGKFYDYIFRGIEVKFRPLNTVGRLFFDRLDTIGPTQLGVLYDFTLKTWGVTNLDSRQGLFNPLHSDKVEFIDNSIVPEKDTWGVVRVVTSTSDNKTRVYYNDVLVLRTTNFGMREEKGRVEFGITNGQILDVEYINVTESEFNVSNEKPVITGEDNTTIKEGTSFDPLNGMSAIDQEDGNLTGNLKIVENTVDSKKPGSYKVTYAVTDKDGNTTTFEREVTVTSNRKPVITGEGNTTIKEGTSFDPLN
ncbi:immunoglobulin-like domain-containing protein, partial [Bacillus toyonensis]